MPQQKPTYQDLETRLAEAERTIATLKAGQAKPIVAKEQDLALRLQVAEDLHRQSEAVFQAIWEISSEAMALSDPNGTVLAANPAYAELYGYALAEVVGHNFAIIFPEERRAWANEQYLITFASPEVPPAFEAEIRRANGERRMVESRIGFVTSDGRRIAMLSTIRDITEHKRTEQALRESEVRYRRIVESTHEGVWVLDLSGVTTYVNTRMATMLGYTPTEMVGRNAFDFVWPEDMPAGQESWQQRRIET
ncbi:MAG TPA: PAS domain S-box protein, partial [Anaerolineae bacterium]|nr:PAS domain S-box protein [Anaerolineae bacterium]